MDNKKTSKLDYIFMRILFGFSCAIGVIGNIKLPFISGFSYLKLFRSSFFWMTCIIIIGMVFFLGTFIMHKNKKTSLFVGLFSCFVFWGCAGLGDYLNYIILTFLAIAVLYFILYFRNNYGIKNKPDMIEKSKTKGD